MLRLSSRPCHLTDTDTHPNTQHTGFVHQDDIFIPTETVKEHLTFHAMLRCDPCIRTEARLRRVDRLLKAVNLEHVAHSMLGGPGSFIRGLSGGERRRVSFATELLSDPVIIFADEFTTGTFMRWFSARGGYLQASCWCWGVVGEAAAVPPHRSISHVPMLIHTTHHKPTTNPRTGLDAAMAKAVCRSLRNIAHSGRLVIGTIHQPSSDVFGEWRNPDRHRMRNPPAH